MLIQKFGSVTSYNRPTAPAKCRKCGKTLKKLSAEKQGLICNRCIRDRK